MTYFFRIFNISKKLQILYNFVVFYQFDKSSQCSYNNLSEIVMNKPEAELKKTVLQKVRSLEKSISLGNSKPKTHHDAKSPGFTRS